MADQYSAESPFIDKEADAADLERKNKMDVATLTAIGKTMGGAGAGLPPSPGPGGGSFGPSPATTAPTPQQMGVTPGPAPAAPAAPMNAFDSFSSFLKETDPSLQALKARAIQGVNTQFDNPAAGFDQGAAISREDMGRAIASARGNQREDLIKTYGPNASQVMPAMGAFDQDAIMQTRDLNRRLTADRATASSQGLGQAIGAAMGLTGQAAQERATAAGLGLDAQKAAEQSRQFEKGLDWQTAEAALGRTFTTEERKAIQEYSSNERMASQDWTAGQAALGRQFTTGERTAIQAYQTAERMGAQDFATAEAALGRKFTTEERQAIQAHQTSERLSTQDFTQIMADRGYAHDKELEIMRDNLQKELQAKGISADVAKQQADQKFQELVQQRDQGFKATQDEIQRKWTTGERIGDEDFKKGIQANEFKQQDSMAKLQALVAENMAKGQWNQESKLQAERLLADAAESEKTRSQQYLMFSAQMAQTDAQFAKEFGLKEATLAQSKAQAAEELKLATKSLGIQEDQWNTLKANTQFDRDLDLAVRGVAMWNGENKEALQPFVSKLAATMGKALGLDPAVMEKAIASNMKETEATKNPLTKNLLPEELPPGGQWKKTETKTGSDGWGPFRSEYTETNTLYWNPDTQTYEKNPVAKYQTLYK